MSDDQANIIDNVKDYYGKVIHSNEDVKTNACVDQGRPSNAVRDALAMCHDEVVTRYFGCGLVFPPVVEDAKVLDFGSGAGRDCYILSKLVGQNGFVTGVDMTEEQVDIATKYISYHMEKFEYAKPNVEFRLGYVEKLKEAGIEDSSYDLIISNCVINLTADKPAVFKEAFRALKEGGEMYFGDIYADREIPENLKSDKELWGQGLAGALYWRAFVELTKEIGFLGPYLVNSRTLVIKNEQFAKAVGGTNYVSATYRLFKPKKDNGKGFSAKYTGTIPEHPDKFVFDHKYTFNADFQKVSSDVGMVLKGSRYAPHFQLQESPEKSSVESTIEDMDPFALVSKQEQPPCCKKAKCS